MATATQISEIIGRIAGVSQTTVETAARLLGEAGQIPRGTRGRAPAELKINDIARIIVGVMTAGDGFGGTTTGVPQAVSKIERQRSKGTLDVIRKGRKKDSETTYSLVVPGSLVDQVANILHQCTDPKRAANLIQLIDGVGLIFSGDHTVGWLETTGKGKPRIEGDLNLLDLPHRRSSILFGDVDLSLGMMTREVCLKVEQIAEIASAIAEIDGEA